jgi:hypothetical protein
MTSLKTACAPITFGETAPRSNLPGSVSIVACQGDGTTAEDAGEALF